ncbi:MAG: methylated-DNA--[protein]-cysteine S-methyltransferase [Bacilli bacterium]|jgi:methylated-DNA-[protein]-cysteine S-methyltransferase|nr:methylated-DNA--[protein]-cysteine S-methyltransferase [Bacilli bacterium]HHU23527.1 methylated-DNA--[protein]-cysteine S-methyltransferase [Acholeplasmataceae bacterium]
MKKQIVFKTPLGFMEIGERNGFVTHANFVDGETPVSDNDSTLLLLEAKRQMLLFFEGKLTAFDLPLIFEEGTPFQQKVWQTLQTIPYGETRSYQDIARLVGNEKACRAVGGANNKNPIAIIVPCHRVIGANGKMVGYGGGIDRKIYLLALERIMTMQGVQS